MPSNTKFIIDHIWTSGANNKLIIKLIIFTFKYPCDIDFHSLAGKKKKKFFTFQIKQATNIK